MAKNLKATEVYRGGQTARALYLETRQVTACRSKAAVQLDFSMDSKGGGVTRVHVNIGPDDFEALVATMVKADRQKAMDAMAAELARQVAEQPEHDARAAAAARDAIRRLAHEKYLNAPADDDETERFAETQIKKLIAEIEAPEAAKGKSSKVTGSKAA